METTWQGSSWGTLGAFNGEAFVVSVRRKSGSDFRYFVYSSYLVLQCRQVRLWSPK